MPGFLTAGNFVRALGERRMLCNLLTYQFKPVEHGSQHFLLPVQAELHH